MSKKDSTKSINLTPEQVYKDLALLTVSIISLFISVGLIGNQPFNAASLKAYIGYGFFVFFLISLASLIGDLFLYYGSKTWGWFKDSVPKYGKYYKGSFLVLALIILVFMGYGKLEKADFWMLLIGTPILAILNLILNGIIDWFKKSKKAK